MIYFSIRLPVLDGSEAFNPALEELIRRWKH
jgi:hypothetical protein